MLKNWIFFLISMLAPLASWAESNCTVSHDSCRFYRCMEKEYPCGKKGYWRNYAIPYCELFLRDEHKFSISTQLWLADNRQCLQQRMKESVNGLSCGEIKKNALHDHVGCYVDTGFCQLTLREQFKILWYIKGAFNDLDTWRQAELVRRACQIP